MSGQIYHHRETPHVPGRTEVQRVHTPQGAVYVPVTSEIQEPQQIREETYRTTERSFLRPDGVEGIERVHEHDVRYAPDTPRRREPTGEIAKVMTGLGVFSTMCVLWDQLGAVAAHLPVYLIGALVAYHWITR